MQHSAALRMAAEPRRCPTGHRNLEEDGVRLERDRGKRWVFVLATCRDCGARLSQRWEMHRKGDLTGRWFVDEARDSA